MKIRVTDGTNPARPFLVEAMGEDGKWVPFGNEVSQAAADKTCDMMVEMYGFIKE